jgi:AbiV family abortive infection protein
VDLERGIAACLVAAQQRLQEARVLVDEHHFLTPAVVLLSFAVEEFGKGMMLRAAYETGQDPATLQGFYEHAAKFAAAEAATGWIPLVYGGGISG